MIETDDIVKQAFDRAGVWPYSQTLQAKLLEQGKRLLKGLIHRYNNDDLLAFTEETVEVKLRGGNVVRLVESYDGVYSFETRDDVPDGYNENTRYAVYIWADGLYYINVHGLEGATADWMAASSLPGSFAIDGTEYTVLNKAWLDAHRNDHYIKVDSCMKIRSVSTKAGGQRLDEWTGCRFMPWDSFLNLSSGANAWTGREDGDNDWVLKFKEIFAKQDRTAAISYNKGFELADELRISDIYAELLIQGLTVKLCLQYPNDDSNTTRQETELANIIANVRTPKANRKMVKRQDCGDGGFITGDELLAGEGLYL